jgi:hypothetical protein
MKYVDYDNKDRCYLTLERGSPSGRENRERGGGWAASFDPAAD